MEKYIGRIDKIIGYLMCSFITYIMFYYVYMPRIIERRGRDLGVMRYSYEKDSYIPKDTITLNSYEFHYMQYGNLDGY